MVTNARYYDTYWSDTGFCPRGKTTPELEKLLKEWIKPNWRCLDVGCGDGQTAGVWLRNYGCDYVGVDISKNAICYANELGLNALAIDDVGKLPFDSQSIDAAICIEVLEHLFSPQSALLEIKRILKPDGIVLVTVPNAVYWRRRVDLLFGRWNPLGDDLSVAQPWRDPHIRFYTPKSLDNLLKSTGLDVVAVGGHGGSLIRDIPVIGRRFYRSGAWSICRLLERVSPSLFGYGLHGIAKASP